MCVRRCDIPNGLDLDPAHNPRDLSVLLTVYDIPIGSAAIPSRIDPEHRGARRRTCVSVPESACPVPLSNAQRVVVTACWTTLCLPVQSERSRWRLSDATASS